MCVCEREREKERERQKQASVRSRVVRSSSFVIRLSVLSAHFQASTSLWAEGISRYFAKGPSTDEASDKPTFKLVLHKRHLIFRVLGPHLLHPRTEARNGKNDDIANLAGAFDPGKVLPRDVLPALPDSKVLGVVEKVEDGIRPHGRARKLHDTLVELRAVEMSQLFHPQRLFGDGRNDVAKHGVTRLGLDSPLAKLYPARVPVLPVRSIRIGFNANDEADCFPGKLRRDPFGGGFECGGVDVGVNAAAGKEDEVAEEIRF